MTIKAFSFLNPISEKDQERNWRQFDENSKFNIWHPTLTDFTNAGTPTAYYQLYGPLVYYYIYIPWNNVIGGITAGAAPRITNIPYGPETPSGRKTSSFDQYLMAIGQGTDLVTGQYAVLNSLAGTTQITMPVWAGGKTKIVVCGWIFRDA